MLVELINLLHVYTPTIPTPTFIKIALLAYLFFSYI